MGKAEYQAWLKEAAEKVDRADLSPFQSRILLEIDGAGRKCFNLVARFREHGADPMIAGPIARQLVSLLDRDLVTHQRCGVAKFPRNRGRRCVQGVLP